MTTGAARRQQDGLGVPIQDRGHCGDGVAQRVRSGIAVILVVATIAGGGEARQVYQLALLADVLQRMDERALPGRQQGGGEEKPQGTDLQRSCHP